MENSANYRKIFNYENQIESRTIINHYLNKSRYFKKSISACGCLFYKMVDGKIQLLLIQYTERPSLDDIGGKIELTDKSITDAIAREVDEETNEVISPLILQKLLENNTVHTFYTKSCKYLLKLVKVEDEFYKDTEIFGSTELHAKHNRTISWCDYKMAKDKLSLRLMQNPELIAYLNSLEQ